MPGEKMKLLGVTLDEKLTWELHNAAAAGKASGIARAIARGTRYLRKADRAALIQALAHPHLDYCQTALANPSNTAQHSMQRAYDRTARIAARMPRSEPARQKLGWPKWGERIEAIREALVAKIWTEKEPACLRKLLQDDDERKTGRSRAQKRGEIEEHPAGRKGKKAFRNWAPEAHNRTCRKVITRQRPAESDTAGKKQKGNIPPDHEATERKGYYAYLRSKYKGTAETTDVAGRVKIWTDGSAIEKGKGERTAGSGIFYGDGNTLNRAIPVKGPATNQRAELAAVVYCIEHESRPMHIYTDSKYVQLGISIWRHKWKAKAWYKSAKLTKEVDHADLWQKLDNLLAQREPGSFEVTWLKGHAMPRHIRQGLTTEEGIWANNEADNLAGQASAMG